jgi:hypothetical protein
MLERGKRYEDDDATGLLGLARVPEVNEDERRQHDPSGP